MKASFPVLIGGTLLASQALAGDDWDFSVEPYLLAASIEGDVGIGRVVGADVSVDFGTILENLNIGAMVRGEALHSSGWGVMLDYAYMALGKDKALPLRGIIDARIRQGVLEAQVFHRMPVETGSLDVYGGIRWWNNDVDATVDPAVFPGSASASVSEDWVDPVLGVRWVGPLAPRWLLSVRGDMGGFGVASDFTASLAAGAQYRLSESVSVDMQYKALWVDYEDGTPSQPGYFNYDTLTHGPLVGVIFAF
jgi:hypothetical protein